MDENELKLDTLQKLQKYVPEEAEQEMYRNWDGDSNDLDIPDQFFYALKDIPYLQERLSLWVFKIQFLELYDDNNQKVATLQKAHDVVKNNDSFKKLLSYILVVGNFMNSGTKKGGAIGFKLDTLTQLESSKSIDGKESVLTFIVTQCKVNHPDALAWVTEFEETLPEAIRLDTNQLDLDIKELGKRLDEVNKRLKSEGTKEEDDKDDDSHRDLFSNVMGEFYKAAFPKYSSLEKSFKKAIECIQALGKYLGEKDADKVEYLSQLNAFSGSVKQAAEAMEWKEEQERKQREKQEKIEKDQTKKKAELQTYRDKKKSHKDKDKAIASRGKVEPPPPPTTENPKKRSYF